MRWFVAALFLLMAISAAAQDTTAFRPWSVTWKPLGVVDPISANLTLGVNYFFHPKWSVDADAGVIRSWNRTTIPDNRWANVRTGVKTSVTLSYHYRDKKHWPYIAINGYHHRFEKAYDEFVWRQGRAYLEAVTLHERTRVFGCYGMVGAVFENKSGRVYYDLYVGYGPRYKEKTESGMPDDGEQIPGGGRYNPFTDIDEELTPSIAAGMRLGYRL